MMRHARRFPVLVSLVFLLTPAAALAASQSCGDVNNSGGLSSSDALLVLKASVGQNVEFHCPAPGSLLVTGQTTCADSSGAVPCTGTKQDGDLQTGLAFDYTDNGDGTITDNVTGLTWEKLSQDSSVHDFRNTYSLADAFNRIGSLNNDTFAGHSDWRMPNLRELQSLVSLQIPGSGAVVQDEFDSSCSLGCTVTTCSCTAPNEYWSSTSYPFAAGTNGMGVYFGGGGAFAAAKDTLYRVRAVRGGVGN